MSGVIWFEQRMGNFLVAYVACSEISVILKMDLILGFLVEFLLFALS